MERGEVGHLDIEKVVMDNFGDLKIVHKERKNMGMTYIYIIENSPKKVEVDEEGGETASAKKTSEAS